jgi:hypothetical protein
MVRLEGGNDLVWQPLVRARLGMLDLESSLLTDHCASPSAGFLTSFASLGA